MDETSIAKCDVPVASPVTGRHHRHTLWQNKPTQTLPAPRMSRCVQVMQYVVDVLQMVDGRSTPQCAGTNLSPAAVDGMRTRPPTVSLPVLWLSAARWTVQTSCLA